MRHIFLILICLQGCAFSGYQFFPSGYTNVSEVKFSHSEWPSMLERTHYWVSRNVEYKTDDFPHWQKPNETLRLGTGDCEDIVLLKQYILLNNGYEPEQMTILVGRNKDKVLHAILRVEEKDGRVWFLDNEQARPSEMLPLSRPIRSVNVTLDSPVFSGIGGSVAYINNSPEF